VQMVGAADVVARDDGDEGGCTVALGGLYAAKRVGLDGCITAVAVALGLDTRVDAGGVATPEFDVSICHGLAAGRVDNVNIEMRDGAQLSGKDVFSDQFTSDPYQVSAYWTSSPWVGACIQ